MSEMTPSNNQKLARRQVAIHFHIAFGRFQATIEMSEETLRNVHVIAGRIHATLYILLVLIQLFHPQVL